VGIFVAGLVLFASGFLAACGGKDTKPPPSSNKGTPTTIVLSGDLTLVTETTPSNSAGPKNQLIVLGHSIAGISLGEPRKSVEKAFGHGTSRRRGLVSYFGGRLQVDYWWHDRLTTRVQGLETRWSGFRTRSGVHVGTSRQALRALHATCGDGECSLAAGRMPDAPGTVFTMRSGKVAEIDIFHA
jgi:hypothetical protein